MKQGDNILVSGSRVGAGGRVWEQLCPSALSAVMMKTLKPSSGVATSHGAHQPRYPRSTRNAASVPEELNVTFSSPFIIRI